MMIIDRNNTFYITDAFNNFEIMDTFSLFSLVISNTHICSKEIYKKIGMGNWAMTK